MHTLRMIRLIVCPAQLRYQSLMDVVEVKMTCLDGLSQCRRTLLSLSHTIDNDDTAAKELIEHLETELLQLQKRHSKLIRTHNSQLADWQALNQQVLEFSSLLKNEFKKFNDLDAL